MTKLEDIDWNWDEPHYLNGTPREHRKFEKEVVALGLKAKALVEEFGRLAPRMTVITMPLLNALDTVAHRASTAYTIPTHQKKRLRSRRKTRK